jgi:hypothetical protein
MNDFSLFILKSTHIKLFVLIYMDDILVIGLNILYIQTLITQLHLKKYPKWSWLIEFFCRHWVLYTFHSIILNQCHYITDLLYKTNMYNAKLVLSYSLFHKIIIIQRCFIFKSYIVSYHSWISQYLFFIYPNISYVVGNVYQFMYSPIINHLSVIKRILRYFKNTIHYSILLTRYNNIQLHVFFIMIRLVLLMINDLPAAISPFLDPIFFFKTLINSHQSLTITFKLSIMLS